MIYFFIFMFGAQVLKGVIEEKSNRIVEVIISSVKPFQLMMGKIVGIAMVGLTQFLLWIILTLIIVGMVQLFFVGNDMASMQLPEAQAGLLNSATQSESNNPMMIVTDILGSINLPVMAISFILYFLGGYLMYASLFAAIGGAVDNDADTQQFMFPVSIPLIFAVAMSGVIVNQPDSTLAIWMSMVPFTSPITMIMRIPFGVPYWELGLSLLLLVIGFTFTTWMAGKIYKTGILMYGKKITYRTLWTWLTAR
jgi:ABC-2 type transport system permease protein